MSQQSKNQLLFGKTEVEDRFVNENQYDGANVPQVVTGGSHNFLDNLSDDVLKQLDEITIIANKQILEKPEWSSFSNFSGDGGGNGGGGSTTTTTTEAPTTTTTTTAGVPQFSPSSSSYISSINNSTYVSKGTTYFSVNVNYNMTSLYDWYNTNAPEGSAIQMRFENINVASSLGAADEIIEAFAPVNTSGGSNGDNNSFGLRLNQLTPGQYTLRLCNVVTPSGGYGDVLTTLETFTMIV